MASTPKRTHSARLTTLLLTLALGMGVPLGAHATEATSALDDAAQTASSLEAEAQEGVLVGAEAGKPAETAIASTKDSASKTVDLSVTASEETPFANKTVTVPEATPSANEAAETATIAEGSSSTEDVFSAEGSSSTEDVSSAGENAAVAASAFTYQHDPRNNPSAMADIIENSRAIYGFSPSPDGTLAQYADVDWTDANVVAKARESRAMYHQNLQELYQIALAMYENGTSTEEIARTVSTKRNEIRMASYADDPEGLARVKARNLEQYGNENGGTPDFFYKMFGSWDEVIEKALSVNSGMDACTGLYDEYYDLYVTAGQVSADEPAETPNQPAVEPDEPTVEPDQPAMEPVKPAADSPNTTTAEPVEAMVTPAGESSTANAAPKALPATGDPAPNGLLVAILAGGAFAACGLALRRRQNKAA